MSPDTESNTNQLDKALQRLQGGQQQLIDLARNMLSNGQTYAMDLLTTAVLNRSVTMVEGFMTLVRANNTLTALHLVRLHLDSLLRYSAAWLVEDPDGFAMAVYAGKPVRKMKDRTGALMTDRYLVDKLTEDYDWVSSVYAETSGYIHLSQKHYHSAIRKKEGEERLIESIIRKDDSFIPHSLKIEATEGMVAITRCIYEYVYGWADTKQGGGQSETNPDAGKE